MDQLGRYGWKTIQFSVRMPPLNDNVFPVHVPEFAQTLPECIHASAESGSTIGSEVANPGRFRRWLRLSVLDENNENSLEQPKEGLWIHGRAYLWAMDMPQSKRNENRYF
jgi:hypothetical protein